jgi:MFS family permease
MADGANTMDVGESVQMTADQSLVTRESGAGRPPRPLWRNRDYMLLWSGQAVSVLGSNVSGIAYPLLILALTSSPAIAGFAFATQALPYLIFSLPAGALVDRWNRKKVMILCDGGRACTLASIPIAYALGHLTVVQLYLTSAIEGTLFVFFNLAETACLPRVVAREQLPAATAQSQAAESVATIVGGPLSGFIFQTLGKTVPFLVDAVSYAASVVSLSFIKTEFQEERVEGSHRLRAEIQEGLSWLWHQPLIRYMAFCTGTMNFAGTGGVLIVIVLARQQHASPAAIGAMFSVASAGGLLGALLAARIQKSLSFSQVIIGTVWIGAVLWPLFAVAPNPLLLAVIFAGLAFTGPIYNATQFGYRLSIIPDALQGRVNSAFRLFAFGFQPVGGALAGVLLQATGPVTAVLIFSATQVALAVLTTANRHVRHARPIAGATPA